MFETQLIFLEVVPSIVNPVNKLCSLAYKVQQTFFVPAIDLVTVFDTILTSRQTREKLQCLYENLMSNNFH